jgi:hypothetical protein
MFSLSADGRRSVVITVDAFTLGWLAGLLEGEGSFMKGPPSKAHLPRISIQMTDSDVMLKVGALFGVKPSTVKARPPRHKEIYHCDLKGSRAVALMTKLRPYMSLRRQLAIDSALASYKPPITSGKIYPTAAQIEQQLKDKRCSTYALARLYGCSRSYITKLLRRTANEFPVTAV